MYFKRKEMVLEGILGVKTGWFFYKIDAMFDKNTEKTQSKHTCNTRFVHNAQENL